MPHLVLDQYVTNFDPRDTFQGTREPALLQEPVEDGAIILSFGQGHFPVQLGRHVDEMGEHVQGYGANPGGFDEVGRGAKVVMDGDLSEIPR
jgi:hypothetical protein